MYAVAGHDGGGLAGKLLAVVAAVIADGDPAAHGLAALGGDDAGKALGRMAHDMHVHAVQPHAHHAAQPRRAEF